MERIATGMTPHIPAQRTNSTAAANPVALTDTYSAECRKDPAIEPLQALHRPSRAATIHKCSGDGTAMTTRILHCDGADMIQEVKDKEGKSHTIYTSDNKTRINMAGAGGDDEISVVLPECAHGECAIRTFYSKQEHALYTLTTEALHRIDTEKNAITATLPHPFGRIHPASDTDCVIALNEQGDLLVARNQLVAPKQRLSILDSTLKEKGSFETDFAVSAIETLPHGAIWCIGSRGYLQKAAIFSADGKSLLDMPEDHEAVGCMKGDDGQAYFIEKSNKKSELVRYDAATGRTLRIKTTEQAEQIMARGNGTMLVVDSRPAGPRLIAYDADGKVLWNAPVNAKGITTEFSVCEACSRAAITVQNEESGEERLYQIDLNAGADKKNKKSTSLLSSEVRKATHLHTSPPAQCRMISSMLHDGQTVIMKKDEILLIDDKGKKIRNYDTSSELLKDIGEDKAELLEWQINTMQKENPSMYSRVRLTPDSPYFNDSDATLTWKAPSRL